MAKNFSTFHQIFEKSIFLPKIVTCLTIKCENEGSLNDKVVSGSFGDKELGVEVGKNGGLSVKAREKK